MFLHPGPRLRESVDNKQLVRGDDGGTNALRDGLGLVQGNAGGERTNTETGDQPADGELVQTSLKVFSMMTPTMSKKAQNEMENLRPILSARGAEHRQPSKILNAEKTDNGTGARRAKLTLVGEAVLKICHGYDTRDLTRLVTEHKTTY